MSLWSLSLFLCLPVESFFGPVTSGTTEVCHIENKKKRKTAVFLSYCHVAPCHATKEGKWKGKKIAIQVAELFFSLLLRRKYRRKSYYYRKDEWFIKKLVINTRQPVTSVLHILHSWSVNKSGRANYSKSLIHIDIRNISWSKQSWWKVFVP